MAEAQHGRGRSVVPAGIDPITFEVLSNAFTAVVDEMGVMLEKVSFSTVTTIGKDYTCALATPTGDVFSRGKGGVPLIGGTVTHRVKGIVAYIPPEEIDEGDVFLHNDPFIGGTHGQDVSAVMPVFWEGELIAFVHAASHWPDTGGAVPGSFNSEATSTHGESIMIPPLHIIREGVWDREIERFILRNVRIPRIIQGDLRGMVEAVRTGREQFLRLVEKYGRDLVVLEMESLMDYAERLLRNEWARLPDGTYSFTDYIDRDPGSRSMDPIPVGLDVTIAGDRATFDFSRSGPQARGPVNCAASATQSGVMTGVRNVFPHIPHNDGIYRAIDWVIPEGRVISAAYPAPVSGHAANSAEKIISCCHGCFIQAIPERAMACPTSLVNISVHGFDERPERGNEYVMYIWLAGGWGGRPGKRDNHTALMPLAAGTSLQPAETLEREYPVMFDGWGLKPDSEGAGRHRGGFGLECPFHVTHGHASINTQGDRGTVPGWGHAGGGSPLGNRLVYAPGTPEEQDVGVMRAGFPVEPNTRLDYWQGGGGGFGPPWERPPEWVLDDVRNGLVSLGRARGTYGVEVRVVDEATLVFEVDEAETERLRAGLRAAAGA